MASGSCRSGVRDRPAGWFQGGALGGSSLQLPAGPCWLQAALGQTGPSGCLSCALRASRVLSVSPVGLSTGCLSVIMM